MKKLVVLLLVSVLMLIVGCSEDSGFNSARDEILKMNRQALSIPMPQRPEEDKYDMKNYSKDAKNGRLSYYKAMDDYRKKLVPEEKKVLEQTRIVDKKVKDLEIKFNKDKDVAKKVAALKTQVRDERVKWVKKISFEDTSGDTVCGVGVGSTWEEVEIVLGAPKVAKEEGSGKVFDYGGLVFETFDSRGAGPTISKKPSPRVLIWYNSNQTFVSDAGVEIGMQLKDAVDLLKKHGKGNFGQPISPVIMNYQLLKDNKWNMPERIFIRIEKGLIKEYWVSYS